METLTDEKAKAITRKAARDLAGPWADMSDAHFWVCYAALVEQGVLGADRFVLQELRDELEAEKQRRLGRRRTA